MFAVQACKSGSQPPEGGAVGPGGSSAPATTAALQMTNPSNASAREVSIAAPADLAEPPADGEKTASGVVTKILSKGSGAVHPAAIDTVQAHVTGWTRDGKMFNSSVVRRVPDKFRVDQVIKGLTEGIELMVTGEKRRLWIPAHLGYGMTPERQGAPYGDLTYDIELLELFPVPPTPEDVKAPPENATKTKSGIVYRVLTKGTGTRHPYPYSQVELIYTGWVPDGRMFETSTSRGGPAAFQLSRMMPGWAEGISLMVEGEKTRFWIPGKLAYGELQKDEKPQASGSPKGAVVYDIELIRILEPTTRLSQ
jgi:FKBP-type peptidyl-prolyl cis-trans isomerase